MGCVLAWAAGGFFLDCEDGMIAIVAAALLSLTEADRAAAVADYHVHSAQHREVRYVECLGTTEREVQTVQLVVQLASRQPSIEAANPVLIPGTRLLRLDLTALGWRREDWAAVYGGKNPYALGKYDPLIVQSHDFLIQILDGRKSRAYELFLFSGKPPKTADGFLKEFKVDQQGQQGLEINHVESQSEVNVNQSPSDAPRLIRFDDGAQTYSFSTYDVKEVREGRDPLEPFDHFAYDGQETFVLFPKIDGSTGTRAMVPAVFLADGQGNLVDEAPEDLVKDHEETFGIPTIVNPGSCFCCHRGPKQLDENAIRQRLLAGVQLDTYDAKKAYEIEVQYLSDMTDQIENWEIGWARATDAICGLDPDQARDAIRASIDDYKKPVDLNRAALELHTTPDKLKAAIGYASSQDYKLKDRLSNITEGIPIPRSLWEDAIDDAYGFLKLWKKVSGKEASK